MKSYIKKAIDEKNFRLMVTKKIKEYEFSSWRMYDEKNKPHFFLIPSSDNPNVWQFGFDPECYEIDYVLLGLLDMIK